MKRASSWLWWLHFGTSCWVKNSNYKRELTKNNSGKKEKRPQRCEFFVIVSLTSLFLLIVYFGFYHYLLGLQEGNFGNFPARMRFFLLRDPGKGSRLSLGLKCPCVVTRQPKEGFLILHRLCLSDHLWWEPHNTSECSLCDRYFHVPTLNSDCPLDGI